MPSNSSVLALFAPQAPVEPTTPKPDYGSDSDFNDFLSDATHQVEKAQQTNAGDSAQNNNQNEIGQADKAKPKIKNSNDKAKTDSDKYDETAASVANEPVKPANIENKETAFEKSAEFAAKLKELGIEQEEFEALLEYLGLNGERDIQSLLKSLTQNLNQNGILAGEDYDALSESELIARLQKHEGQAIDLLKKAGLTDEQAKNLVNYLKTPSTTTTAATAQKEVDKTLDLNVKKDIQEQQVASAEKESAKQVDQSESSKNTGQRDKGNEAGVSAQAKEVSAKPEKSERAASLDKLPQTPKAEEAPRINPKESAGDKGVKDSNLTQLLKDNNAQATLVQTEGGKDASAFKGVDAAKTGPDLQVQAPTSVADNAIKATQANKSVLPEKMIARGASETKIINQIVNKLNVRTTGAQNEVHVKLDPPSLGTVRLNISTVGDSVRTVIIAENHAVKQTIESNFGQLRDAMSDQGLKVDSFSVTVGGESGNPNQNEKELGDRDPSGSLQQDQMASSDMDLEFEETNMPFIFDGNQSISVLA
ncbi:MAG: flagellar hook-length control protein FliK [Nitrospinota bacterium]